MGTASSPAVRPRPPGATSTTSFTGPTAGRRAARTERCCASATTRGARGPFQRGPRLRHRRLAHLPPGRQRDRAAPSELPTAAVIYRAVAGKGGSSGRGDPVENCGRELLGSLLGDPVRHAGQLDEPVVAGDPVGARLRGGTADRDVPVAPHVRGRHL